MKNPIASSKTFKHTDSSYKFTDSQPTQEEAKICAQKKPLKKKKKKKVSQFNNKGKIVLNSLVHTDEVSVQGSDSVNIPVKIKSQLHSLTQLFLSDDEQESIDRSIMHRQEIQ